MPRSLMRFAVVGLLTTGMSYLTLVGLMRLGVHYLPAGLASWITSMLVAFVLHRFYTFEVRTRHRTARDFVMFVTGALMQLALGLLVYAGLIGNLGMAPTPAFAINLIITSTFSYLFMKLITFRSASAR